MIINKTIISRLFTIVITLTSFPVFATPTKMNQYLFFNKAHDFYSLSVNGGYCTVPDVGFAVPNGNPIIISTQILLRDCQSNQCDIAIHISQDCSGPIIGSIFMQDVKDGITSTQPYANYKITYTTDPSSQFIYVTPLNN